jgi:hypothetical protein
LLLLLSARLKQLALGVGCSRMNFWTAICHEAVLQYWL